jgi:hypothetical protein
MTQEELQKEVVVIAEQVKAFRAKIDELYFAQDLFQETLTPLISDLMAVQSELASTLATIGSLSYVDLEAHCQRFVAEVLKYEVRGLNPLGVEAGNYDDR